MEGVYKFASIFSSELFSFLTAVAFESVYIGLSVALGLEDKQRKRATAISAGAVGVSVIFNVLSGWFHLQPGILKGTETAEAGKIILALIHGTPMAILGFLVAHLLLHSKTETKLQPKEDPLNVVRGWLTDLSNNINNSIVALSQQVNTTNQRLNNLENNQPIDPMPLLAQALEAIERKVDEKLLTNNQPEMSKEEAKELYLQGKMTEQEILKYYSYVSIYRWNKDKETKNGSTSKTA